MFNALPSVFNRLAQLSGHPKGLCHLNQFLLQQTDLSTFLLYANIPMNVYFPSLISSSYMVEISADSCRNPLLYDACF